MAAQPLQHLADRQEIDMGFQRRDGAWRSTPVWIVQVGDELFVRSMNGPTGGWYRRLRAVPDGEVRDGGHVHPVRADPVSDEDTLQAVTHAYERKYADSPYLQPFKQPGAIGATLRLRSR